MVHTRAMKNDKVIHARFFAEVGGNEPVRDFLRSFHDEDRRIIGGDLRLLQRGWPQGLPVCRPLGEKLYEVRSTITHGRQVRVLFIFWQGEFWLLHGFIKKTEKTPEEYLKLARKRMQSVITQSNK